MWRHVFPLLAVLLAMPLAACGGRPDGLMRPVPAPTIEGAKQVPILVATTRRMTDDIGILFTGERGRGLAYAAVDVSVPPVHRPGEVEWPPRFPGDPALHFVTTRAETLDQTAFRSAVRARIAREPSRHVLIFVHGYNNRFDDAVYRLAQIKADLGTSVVPILFTWPSRGRLLEYPYDRESATFSRDALERLLDELAAEPSVRHVSILAHSMGNWVTLEALRQLGIKRGFVPAKIDDVMLAAPDVDVDLARTAAARMGSRRPRMTLFVSQDDRALAISRRVWGGTTRLGAIDPTQEPYKSGLARLDIDAVDLTKVRGSDMLNHGKFADSAVVRAIGNRLATGQSIGTRDSGLGELIAGTVSTVATTVGTTAGAVVTAPLAIVDAETRENNIDRLGSLLPGGVEGAENLSPLDEPPVPRRTPRAARQ